MSSEDDAVTRATAPAAAARGAADERAGQDIAKAALPTGSAPVPAAPAPPPRAGAAPGLEPTRVTVAALPGTAPTLVKGARASDATRMDATQAPGGEASHRRGRGGVVDSWDGEVWGDFQLDELIGKGGMGAVYRGRQLSLDRPVAIKVLSESLTDSGDFRKRFLLEARAAARINSPHVVQVYFAGEQGRQHYFAMEYVEGVDLARKLKDGYRPSHAEALDLVIQATRGLVALSEHHIVHRDIKPANFMVTNRGQLKLMDFGLVKFASESHGLTQTGMVMGTVSYFSPEQGRGDPCDARTDIYAMGVVFYELLTGRLPFTGDNPTSVIYQHLHVPPKPPKEHDPLIAEPFQSVVLRCLEKDPAKRYQHASDLLADLERMRAGQQPLAALGGAPTSGGGARRLAIAGGVAAAVLLAIVLVQNRPFPPRPEAAPAARDGHAESPAAAAPRPTAVSAPPAAPAPAPATVHDAGATAGPAAGDGRAERRRWRRRHPPRRRRPPSRGRRNVTQHVAVAPPTSPALPLAPPAAPDIPLRVEPPPPVPPPAPPAPAPTPVAVVAPPVAVVAPALAVVPPPVAVVAPVVALAPRPAPVEPPPAAPAPEPVAAVVTPPAVVTPAAATAPAPAAPAPAAPAEPPPVPTPAARPAPAPSGPPGLTAVAESTTRITLAFTASECAHGIRWQLDGPPGRCGRIDSAFTTGAQGAQVAWSSAGVVGEATLHALALASGRELSMPLRILASEPGATRLPAHSCCIGGEDELPVGRLARDPDGSWWGLNLDKGAIVHLSAGWMWSQRFLPPAPAKKPLALAPRADGLYVLDGESRSVLLFLGALAKAHYGSFAKPTDLAFTADGSMAIADQKGGGIVVLGPDGQKRSVLVRGPGPAGGFDRLTRLCAGDDGTLYALDSGARLVCRYDRTLAPLPAWNLAAGDNAIDLLAAPQGLLVLLANGAIRQLSDAAQGAGAASSPPPALAQLGTTASPAAEELGAPGGLCLDADGGILVAYEEHGMIVRTSARGQLTGVRMRRLWGQKMLAADGQGRLAILDQGERWLMLDQGERWLCLTDALGFCVRRLGGALKHGGSLKEPVAICLSPDGGAATVLDGDTRQVVRFAFTAGQSRSFAGKGQGAGLLDNPVALAMDEQGASYVLDLAEHRVSVYDDQGAFRFAFGRAGDGADGLRSPRLLAVAPAGDRAYVYDDDSATVKCFAIDAANHRALPAGVSVLKGAGPGQILHLVGLGCDRLGLLYLADSKREDLQVLDLRTRPATLLATIQGGALGVRRLQGLCVAPDGQFYLPGEAGIHGFGW